MQNYGIIKLITQAILKYTYTNNIFFYNIDLKHKQKHLGLKYLAQLIKTHKGFSI